MYFFLLKEEQHVTIYNTFNAMTFVQSFLSRPLHFELICLVSQPTKRKKIKVKGYLARGDKERMLTWRQHMEFFVVLFHVPVQSNDVLVCTKQNARSVHFYWAQENSQSKLQWVSSIPLLVRQCHWRERLRVLKLFLSP